MAKICDYFDNAAKSMADFRLFLTAPNPTVPLPPAVALGVYRTGTWYLDKNGNNLWDGRGTDGCVSWGGAPDDQLIVGKRWARIDNRGQQATGSEQVARRTADNVQTR